MTINELIKVLRAEVKNNPAVGKLPVHMFSDAEGNDMHELEQVAYDGDDETADHGLGVSALLLIPKHGSIGDW